MAEREESVGRKMEIEGLELRVKWCSMPISEISEREQKVERIVSVWRRLVE